VAFEEAARLDGAGELRVLARILLPIAWPGFLTIGLVSGLSAYNEFFFAITFINSDSVKPVTTSFLAFENQFTTNWTLTSAAALIVVVPVAAFFLAFQRQFVQGLASAGLKG
jgi:raffinose/stachyose/melibiose transport system permease protein